MRTSSETYADIKTGFFQQFRIRDVGIIKGMSLSRPPPFHFLPNSIPYPEIQLRSLRVQKQASQRVHSVGS